MKGENIKLDNTYVERADPQGKEEQTPSVSCHLFRKLLWLWLIINVQIYVKWLFFIRYFLKGSSSLACNSSVVVKEAGIYQPKICFFNINIFDLKAVVKQESGKLFKIRT